MDNQIHNSNNAYSFTLPPHSIQKQKCLYIFRIHKSQEQAVRFDTVKVRYYDESDKKQEIMIIDKMSNCWSPQLFEPEEEWALLGKRRFD